MVFDGYLVDFLGFIPFLVSMTLFSILFLKEGNIFSPLGLFLGWVIFFIFFDLVYVVFNDSYGPGEYDRYQLYPGLLGEPLLAWSMAIFGYMLGYIGSMSASMASIRYYLTINFSHDNNFYKGIVITVSVCFILSMIGVYAVYGEGIAGGQISELTTQRNSLFSDGGGVYLALIHLYSFSVIFLFSYQCVSKRISKVVIFHIITVAIIDLFLGVRSALLYGFLLPVAIIYHHKVGRIKLKNVLLVGLFLALSVGVLYRSLVRDVGFQANQDLSPIEIFINNVSNLSHFIWGGYEASSFDGIIDVVDKYKDQNMLYGQTILAGLSSPIPRTLWEDKPRGGANYIYTSKYYPDFYGDIRSEYSISFVGECYINFGHLGVFSFFLCIGYMLSKLFSYAIAPKGSVYSTVLWLTLYSIVVSRFFSLLRGDLFNFWGQLFIALASVLIIYFFVSFLSRVRLS